MEPPSDVLQFLGMVNQLGKFTSLLEEYFKSIRDLLSTKNQFYWGPDQHRAFDLIKQLLTNTPVLALYDPNWYTVLKTDASKYGLGATLFQKRRLKTCQLHIQNSVTHRAMLLKHRERSPCGHI